MRTMNQGKGILNESKKLSFSATLDYTLRSAKGGRVLPIIGRIDSDVRMSIQGSYAIDQSWNGIPGNTEEGMSQEQKDKYKNRGSKTYSVRPSLSYSFSRAVSGGLQGEYSSQTYEVGANMGRKTIGISIWTQLKF